MTPRDFRFARAAASQCAALLQQRRTGGPMDCAIHAPASEKGGICCIHNGFNFKLGDVGASQFDAFLGFHISLIQ